MQREVWTRSILKGTVSEKNSGRTANFIRFSKPGKSENKTNAYDISTKDSERL